MAEVRVPQLLAVPCGHDDHGVVHQPRGLHRREQLPDRAIPVEHPRVVEPVQVLSQRQIAAQALHEPGVQVDARLRGLPVAGVPPRGRRVAVDPALDPGVDAGGEGRPRAVGVVDLAQVDHREEGPLVGGLDQPVDDRRRGPLRVLPCVQVGVEVVAQPVAAADRDQPRLLGVQDRAVAVVPQHLGQGRRRRVELVAVVQQVVVAGVQAAEDARVRRVGPGPVRVGVLEHHAARGQRLQRRAGGPIVAVDREPVTAQRAERDHQDVGRV